MVHEEGVGLLLRGVDFGGASSLQSRATSKLNFFRWKYLFTTRKDLIKSRASGWYFWGVVVAVAFPGPYGPETGYDPRDISSAQGKT